MKKLFSISAALLLCAWPVVGNAQEASGSVLAWGHYGYGQTNVPVAAQTGVTAIAAAGIHTVALKNDGSVLSWGHYSGSYLDEEGSGFADDYDFGQSTVPVSAQNGVKAIAAGGFHTVALKNDGSVLGWNPSGSSSSYFRNSLQYNYYPYDYGQATVPVTAQTGVMAIAAGYSHTIALRNDGSVVAWGDNTYGQTNVPVAAQSGVTAIAAGSHHSVALKSNGSVVAWGNNNFGQTNVPVAAQSGVTAIAAGSLHTVVLKNNGSVVSWGHNYYGQTNVHLAAQSGVTAIAAGDSHTVALKDDESVVAWGCNDFGQTNVPLAAQNGVTAIAAGGGHTVALLGTAPPTPPSPQLTTTRSGTAVILSWPTNAVAFTLHSSTNLSNAAWTPVAQLAVTNGNQVSVTVPKNAEFKFFRLKSP